VTAARARERVRAFFETPAGMARRTLNPIGGVRATSHAEMPTTRNAAVKARRVIVVLV